jgi:peptidoglycan/xylan/chitin deacetylase (PgdA/CDA1 family)
MKHITQLWKSLVWGTLFSGYRLSCCLSSEKNTPAIPVLLYHSISQTDNRYAVAPPMFAQQMRYLKAQYCPVRLLEVAEFVKGQGTLPDRAIAVTFDDGYIDFFTNAFPLLEKYGIPATVFICGGNVERKALGNDLPLLSWKQLRALHHTGLVEIGSHALTHQNLTQLSQADAITEISASRAIIGTQCGVSPCCFAYPRGHFNRAVVQFVEQAGYEAAVTVESHLVQGGNPQATRAQAQFMMPRLQIDRLTSFRIFQAKLTHASNWHYAVLTMMGRRRRYACL